MTSSERSMPMKRTDFAVCLNRYLTDYMVNVRGSTTRTIESRYAFVFLLEYYACELKIPADAITLKDLTYEHILGFYVWLEKERKAGISTRNQRQSVIIPRDRRTVSAVQHNRNSHQHLNSNPHFSTI